MQQSTDLKRILIFDDDVDILEICVIILSAKNYKVLTETSCENVIEKVKNHRPNIILMDNKIPEMGGVAASQLIKTTEYTKDIPVIFFSAYINITELCKQAKADYFLQKPFNITDLENIVEAALEKQKD